MGDFADINFTKREVWKGWKPYFPGYGIHVSRRRDKGFTLTGYFEESQWYDPGLLPEQHRSDWLKLGGVSYFHPFKPSTWPKDRCAALGAFRMGYTAFTWEIAGYTNMADGSHHDGEPVLVRADQVFQIDYHPFNGVATFDIKVQGGKQISDALKIDFERWQMTAGAWHGGDVPAPVTHHIRTALTIH